MTTRLWVGVREAERGRRQHWLRNALSRERERQGGCYTLREVGYIESAVRISPSIRCSVGQLISPFLSQAQSTATQPTLHVLSSTTFDTLHTVNESSLERAVSLRSVLHTLFHLHPRTIYQTQYLQRHLYILTTLQLRIKVSFRWIRKNLNNSNNYDGGGTMLLSQNLPVRVKHTRTQRSPSHCLLANAPPSPPSSSFPSLLGVGSSSNTSSKATRRIFLPRQDPLRSSRAAHPRVYRRRHLV
jgi:hypothetical protein